MLHFLFLRKPVIISRMKFTQFNRYSQLMRLDKPVGIFLLLWPTLMALWVAGQGKPSARIVLVFVIGVLIMRSAGCVINDIADRHLDKAVARTKDRPLASGRISCQEAWLLFVALISVAFILVLQLDRDTILLSFVGLLLAMLYPFMKRYTHFPQFILGVAFGWSIPMAFSALTQGIPVSAMVLYLATICWAIVYDTEYAMVDREDDLRIGIKSTAIFFGKYDRFIIAVLQCIVLGLFIILGRLLALGLFYPVGLLFAAITAVYQQYLIKDREPQQCFKAFLSNHWFGAFIFMGLWLDSMISL